MRRHNRPDNVWTLSLLAIGDGERALEVGFGPGDAIRLAAEAAPSCRIAGVDHSATMLAAARQLNRVFIEQGRVRLSLGSVDALPFADDAFDKVFSINCIYFWRDPALGLGELRRVVETGHRRAHRTRHRACSVRRVPARHAGSPHDRSRFRVGCHPSQRVPSHPLACVLGTK